MKAQLTPCKLGYGGTKTEMERLLKDAERISGKKFKIESYADIVEAIHVIQENMGIAGTTAEEAAETISGSLAMTKSAWQNLMIAIGSGEGIEDASAALIDSAKTFGRNLMGALKRILPAIGTALSEVLPALLAEIPGFVAEIGPQLLGAAVTMIKNLGVALTKSIGKILPKPLKDKLGKVFGGIFNDLPNKLKQRFGKFIDWIKYIPNAVSGGIRAGFDLKTIVGNILTGGAAGNIMKQSFSSFVKTIVKPALSKALGQLFGNSELGDKIADLIAPRFGALVMYVQNMIGNLKDTFFGMWENIKEGDWKGVGQVLWNGIKSGFNIVGDWIKGLVLGNDYQPDSTWADVGGKIWGLIKSGFEVAGTWLQKLVMGDDWTPETSWADVGGKIWDAIKAGITVVGDWIKSLVMGDEYTPDTTWGDVGGKIWDAIKAGVNAAGDWIKSLVLGDDYTPDSTWGDVGGKIWDAIKAGFSAVGDWIKSLVMGDDWTPDTTWSDVGGKIWSTIVSGISTGVDWITGFYNSVSGTLDDIDWEGVGSTIWDKIKSAFSSVVNWFKGLFGGEGGEGGYEGTSVKDAILEIDWLGLGTAILGYIKSAFFGVAGIFKGFFSGVWTSIKTIDWAGLGEAMWFDIRQAFGKIGEWFSDTFKAPINIVIGFLNSMIAKVRDALNTVIDFINNSLNITIPSVTFDANPWSPNFGVHTDYKHPAFNWNPGIDRLAWSDNAIPLLANGGIVKNGGRAIVGEYAPEALRVVNGQAIVTPLGTDRFNTGDNFTFNVYAQPGMNAQEIALAVKRVFLREDAQRRAVFA